jgi:fibronectin type 3 domain-containing protein
MQTQQSVTITEIYPEKVPKVTAKQLENKVLLTWEYSQWSGKNNDIAFQFLLFRSDDNQLFTQVNEIPLLRLDGMPNRYLDESIIPGEKYRYKIVAVDAIDRTGPAAETVIQTRDIVPPKRPMNLTTEVIDEKVHLSWQKNSEPDLQGYHVYRQEVNQLDTLRLTPEILPIKENAYVDSTMKYGISYYYSITAIDKNGNESRHSNRMDALVTDRTPPLPPANLKAFVEEDKVTLTWQPSLSADAIGYFVRRGYNPGKPYRLNDKIISEPEYADIDGGKNKLTPGQKYYYSVVAVDTMTYKSQPTGIWVTIPDNDPPQPPGAIQVENMLNRGIQIKWNPSISPDVRQYKISRIRKESNEILGTVAQDILEFQDNDLVRGQQVQYFITAIDTAGNESEKTFSRNIMYKDYSAPSAPAFLTAVFEENRVVINWEPVGDFDLAGYNVYRGKSRNAVGTKINSAIITQTDIIDETGMKDFWYWVKSVDTSGNESKRSPAVQVK